MSGATASPWRQPAQVWAVAFACVVAFMGIGLVDPILPAIADSLEASPVQTELLFTSYLVVTGLAMLFFLPPALCLTSLPALGMLAVASGPSGPGRIGPLRGGGVGHVARRPAGLRPRRLPDRPRCSRPPFFCF